MLKILPKYGTPWQSPNLHVLGRVDKFATVGILTWTILKVLKPYLQSPINTNSSVSRTS